jgi:ethanolamine ammonia-lyase small subunit
MKRENEIVMVDAWQSLKKFTDARIALGRTGVSIPTNEHLQFKMAHAFARDAVYTLLNMPQLQLELTSQHLPHHILQSCAIDKKQYLQRPDLGRQLHPQAIAILEKENTPIPFDICINITDGLSADAINKHAIPLLRILIPALKACQFSIAPICIIENGRVAISDYTGNLINAKLSIILIGERPGLSATDSLGVYLTYGPKVGNTDAFRNCVSNIRPAGLTYETAAKKIIQLVQASMRLQLTGVELKDNDEDLISIIQ